MSLRRAIVSGRFYPEDKADCERRIEECLRKEKLPAELPDKIVAGIVPHAGWDFSGSTAGLVFSSIKAKDELAALLLYGAVHTWGVSQGAIMGQGAWETPIGKLEIDVELAGKVNESAKEYVIENPKAHSQEHSIEVQLPFIKYLFPEAKIVPIMVPADDNAVPLGQAIGDLIRKEKKKIIVLGTTDLTHYGFNYDFTPHGVSLEAVKWVKEVNDKRIVDLALHLQAEEIVREAHKSHNACGSGALAATVASARALGAKRGKLLKYTTSYDEIPRYGASNFVGYAAIIF